MWVEEVLHFQWVSFNKSTSVSGDELFLKALEIFGEIYY